MCDQMMRDVYQATQHKEDTLFTEGYSVMVMWEYEQLKQENNTVRQRVDSF